MTIQLPRMITLTREDEVAFAKRIEAGVFARHLLEADDGSGRDDLAAVAADGETAWGEFFLANLRMVMAISARWARRYRLDVEDIFQEGCLGLARSIQCWDHARGTKFCTLAWRQITWRVRRICVERAGAGAAPAWWLDAQVGTRNRHAELCTQWGREPTVSELAEQMGQAVEQVERALVWEPPRCVAVMPDIPASPADAPSSSHARCAAGLARIPEQERRIIVAHWGLAGAPQSYEALASAVGWSVRQVKAVEERGLSRLRQLMGSYDDPDAFDAEQLAWAA